MFWGEPRIRYMREVIMGQVRVSSRASGMSMVQVPVRCLHSAPMLSSSVSTRLATANLPCITCASADARSP